MTFSNQAEQRIALLSRKRALTSGRDAPKLRAVCFKPSVYTTYVIRKDMLKKETLRLSVVGMIFPNNIAFCLHMVMRI